MNRCRARANPEGRSAAVIQVISLVVLALAGPVACAPGAAGRTYTSARWVSGRPLGRVLLIAPATVGDEDGRAGEELRRVLRRALRQSSGDAPAEVVEAAAADGRGVVRDDDALATGRGAGAQTVCVVTLRGVGRLPHEAPPGFTAADGASPPPAAAAVGSIRLIDVPSGELLLAAVRARPVEGGDAPDRRLPARLAGDLAAALWRPSASGPTPN